MPPSNEIEPNAAAEDSSSSGGSFVNSMNRLSTAKSDSSNGSPDASDMSGQSKTSEVSEESDPESTKDASDEGIANSDSKDSTKEEGEQQPGENIAPVVALAGSLDTSVAQLPGMPKGDDIVPEIALGLHAQDSDKSVEALALIAVEAGAKHSPIDASSLQLSADANSARSQREPAADNPPPAAAIYTGRLDGASSDQSVEQTVESSISGNSVRSENMSVLPTNADAFKTAASAASVEPPAPMGHIHMKPKKSAARPRFSSANVQPPGPVVSMSSAPVVRSTKSKPSSLRRGKWTAEEEAYVARVIQDFNSGFLNAPAGTTLRSYLSEKLHCDPMRITKKFTGDSCIGKRVFHPVVRCSSNAAAIDKAQTELDALERRWRRRLEMQQRESAKKAAASAAAAVAAATGRSHIQGQLPPAPIGAPGMGNPHHQGVPPQPPSGHHVNQTAVARTATWLDRANAILSSRNDVTQPIPIHAVPTIVPSAPNQPTAMGSLPQQEIENQMKEVQRLIHEGPIIQQTTAGLPHLLEHPSQSSLGGQRKVTEEGSMQQQSAYSSSPSEPADKRARTSFASDNSSGAEDAEALVGFLNSVRASAEASGNEFSNL